MDLLDKKQEKSEKNEYVIDQRFLGEVRSRSISFATSLWFVDFEKVQLMEWTTIIPVIWWGLVALLIAVAVWFFRTILAQRAPSNEHWRDQIEIIEHFSQSIFRQNTPEDILWDIASSCIEKLGLEDCVIYLKSDEKKVWVQKAAYGPKSIDYRALHEPMELKLDEGIVGRVGTSGVAEIVEDTSTDKDYVVDDAHRGSEMAVPILCDGNVIGVIDSEHSLKGFFKPHHLRVMQSIANICGQKIGRSLGEQRIQEFAKFFQLNPNPVARIALDGEILLMNDAAVEMFGKACTKAGRVLPSHTLWELVELLAEGAEDIHSTVNIDGRWCQVALARVPGKPFAHLYAVDVSEVHEARSRAAQAERHKSDFLSVMSHEIRTPLNGILGLIELMMRSDQSEEERRTHLSYMEFAGNHLKGLLTDVLDLERLGSGKAEPHPSSFATRDFFKRIVNSFDKRAKATGNRLALTVDNAVPTALVADVGWITQMLNNLIANALKFTSDGDIVCGIDWNEGRLTMRVSDTGRGIAESDLERILAPFEQADKSTVNVTNQGVGLGLAITQKLVELHGGKLHVKSQLGEGSTFLISLPLQEGEVTVNTPSSLDESRRALIPEAPVLIVDDNELNVLVAKRLVSNWGYAVVSANGVKQAEIHLRSAQPFLVLLDIHMPEVDGFEATKTWRQSEDPWSEVPIVGLTADAESKTRDLALNVGMNDVVVKPFNPPHLRSVIERFGLEHAQQKRRRS